MLRNIASLVCGLALIVGMILTASSAHAAPINLAYSGNGGTVIAFTSQLGAGFAANKIIDGVNVDNVNSGNTAAEPSQTGFWLATSRGPESVTIDLGNLDVITQFRIANTDNSAFKDRGATSFSIFASETVTGTTLNSPTTLISNQSLTWPLTNQNAIPFAVFTSNYGAFRYIQIEVSIPTTVGPTTTGGTGLNELQVIGTVPEPGSLALLAGAGLIMLRRRRGA